MATMTIHQDHRQIALQHLEAAQAARLHLEAVYAQPRHDRAMVADLNHQIGAGMKLAEIHATLAIGQQLERLLERGEINLGTAS